MSGTGLRARAVANAIRRHRLIVVLRRVQPRERLIALVDELAEAGARLFEITMDGPAAAEDLAAVRDHLAARSEPHLIGAGTVLRRPQLDDAAAAGADFAVAPILDHELLSAAIERGMPFIPGALSPTEIASAWEAGATFVKLFPASAVGPALVRELRGPLPDVELIPTGGVDASNAAAFLEAGAAAVGIGGAVLRATPEERAAIVRSLSAGGSR